MSIRPPASRPSQADVQRADAEAPRPGIEASQLNSDEDYIVRLRKRIDDLETELKEARKKATSAEHHLAEVVDECVFAENETEEVRQELEKWKRHCSAVEDGLSNFMAYTVQIERRCLIPAIGDLHNYFAASQMFSDARMHRTVAMSRAGEALAEIPQPKRQQLLDLINKPLSQPALADVEATRKNALPPNQTAASVPLEDALVLIGQLVRSTEELQVLLADTRQRFRNSRRQKNGEGEDKSDTNGVNPNFMTAEELESTEAGRQMKQMLEQLKSERDALLVKTQSARTYEELQQQYYTEREQLQKRIAALESARHEDDKERVAVANRFETLKRALDQSYQEKGLLQEEVDKLRREAMRAKQQQSGSLASDSEKELHSLRMEMDRMIRQHSTNVTELESTIATLRVELSNAQANASIQQKQQLRQLHEDNESLRKSLAELQLRTASSPSARAGGESTLDGKIRAFEITIGSLNTELAQMERKISAAEDRYAAERARLIAAQDQERLQYQEEREECDQLVLKMTNELESLVRENTALKVKLRTAQY